MINTVLEQNLLQEISTAAPEHDYTPKIDQLVILGHGNTNSRKKDPFKTMQSEDVIETQEEFITMERLTMPAQGGIQIIPPQSTPSAPADTFNPIT